MEVGATPARPTAMAVGSAVPVGADDTVPGPMATDRRRTVVRSTVVVVVVGAVLAVLAWWPEPGPPALVPDAVGATPRAPRGPVAWRWSLPQEGPVQYLDVVGDTLVVMDLHTTVGAGGLPRRPVQRLRLVDTVTGGVQWQHRLIRSVDCPQEARPFRHNFAFSSASSSSVTPFRFADDGHDHAVSENALRTFRSGCCLSKEEAAVEGVE